MVGLALFGVGAVGDRCIMPVPRQVVAATASPKRAGSRCGINRRHSYVLAKALLRIAAIISAAAVITSFHFGLRWYLALLVGVLPGARHRLLLDACSDRQLARGKDKPITVTGLGDAVECRRGGSSCAPDVPKLDLTPFSQTNYFWTCVHVHDYTG